MGRSVDIRKINYQEYHDALSKNKTKESDISIEQILLFFGEKIGDQYILLCNEFWEESNSYYSLFSVLEKVLGIEKAHKIFLHSSTEVTANMGTSDFEEKFNIELPDEDEEEE